MKSSGEKFCRRSFFAFPARCGVLSAMAIVTAVLAARRTGGAGEDVCINRSVGQGGCRNCGILNRCNLPHAVSARNVLTGNNNGKR